MKTCNFFSPDLWLHILLAADVFFHEKYRKKLLLVTENLTEILKNLSENIFTEVFPPKLYPPKIFVINVILTNYANVSQNGNILKHLATSILFLSRQRIGLQSFMGNGYNWLKTYGRGHKIPVRSFWEPQSKKAWQK